MFIPPKHIVPELRAPERFGAIRELLQRLIRVGALPAHSEEPLVAAFEQREAALTTGVGFGSAFPHVFSEVVAAPVTALGRSAAGVDFASVDGRPVQTVVLTVFPATSPTTYPHA